MAQRAGINGLALTVGAGGAVLVYAGLRGENPLEAVRGILAGSPAPVQPSAPITLKEPAYTFTPAGGEGPAPASSPALGRAVSVALQQVGKPYRWGASGPDAFDCSGLIVYSYRAAGIPLPRYTSAVFAVSTNFRKISRADVAAGDVCWKVGHVALAISNSAIVEAPHRGVPVRTRSISGFTMYLRYVGPGSQTTLAGPR
jgi:cell wall-associated NlpC family hydrolase